jgi:hypothetical protein
LLVVVYWVQKSTACCTCVKLKFCEVDGDKYHHIPCLTRILKKNQKQPLISLVFEILRFQYIYFVAVARHIPCSTDSTCFHQFLPSNIFLSKLVRCYPNTFTAFHQKILPANCNEKRCNTKINTIQSFTQSF